MLGMQCFTTARCATRPSRVFRPVPTTLKSRRFYSESQEPKDIEDTNSNEVEKTTVDGDTLRKMQMEARVGGLYSRTMEEIQSGDRARHPLDQNTKDQSNEAFERLQQRADQIRLTDPSRYEALMALTKPPSGEDPTSAHMPEPDAHPEDNPWAEANVMWNKLRRDVTRDVVDQSNDTPMGHKQPLEQQLSQHERENERFWWLNLDEDPNGLNYENHYEKNTKKKGCIFCGPDRNKYPLEPMNIPLLLNYMNEGGFIRPRRQTGLCMRMQKRVAKTIKQARSMGLFSYKKGEFIARYPLDDGTPQGWKFNLTEEEVEKREDMFHESDPDYFVEEDEEYDEDEEADREENEADDREREQ